MKSGRTGIKIISTGIAVLAAAGLLLLGYHAAPGGSGILADLKLVDGSEYKITQTCNWNPGEPYTVDFFMRGASGPWGWCYIDHESRRWRNVAMFHDRQADTVVVTANGIRKIVLNRKQGLLWRDGYVHVEGFSFPKAPQAEAGRNGAPPVPD